MDRPTVDAVHDTWTASLSDGTVVATARLVGRPDGHRVLHVDDGASRAGRHALLREVPRLVEGPLVAVVRAGARHLRGTLVAGGFERVAAHEQPVPGEGPDATTTVVEYHRHGGGRAAAPADGAHADGAFGELVLRTAADGHHEVVSNGTFLMDTRNGESERALVTAALDACAGEELHVLVAGLGVGFSLAAALASDRVGRVTVVEVEPAVIGFVRDTTGAVTGADLDDPRVRVALGDVADVLAEGRTGPLDVLCLDVDNGPGWVVGERNARLYDEDGVRLAASRLRPGGVLAVWSAHAHEEFEAVLRRVFGRVEAHEFPVPRGAPDVVWVASDPR